MRQKWVLLFSEDGLFHSVSLQPGSNPQAGGRKERRGVGSVTVEVSQWCKFVFRRDTVDVVSLSPGGSGRALGSCVSIPERGLWSEQQPCLDSNIASLEVWVKPMGCGSLPLSPSFFCTALCLCDLERRHATFPWCLCKMAGCKHSQSLFLFTLSLLGVLAASQGRTAL